MNQCEWIVCERRGLWTAALRVARGRQASLSPHAPRIYEVRSLGELAERLTMRPVSLVLVEVHASNFGDVLRWLADSSRSFPQARFAALLDETVRQPKSRGKNSPVATIDILASLYESGIADFADSPRRLHHVFALAEKHAAVIADARSDESQSITDWAWSQLPWQTDS